jgi:glycosyltransferase involved in cell wall biosynthesis
MTGNDRSMTDQGLAVDARVVGDHGIARYSREVRHRLPGLLRMTETTGSVSLAGDVRLRAACTALGGRLYSPGFRPPLPPLGATSVLTLHDLIHLEDPDESSLAKRAYYYGPVRWALRRAGLVFTVSEFSKGRIAELFGVDPGQVVVTGNGVAGAFLEPAAAYPPPTAQPYVVFVGNPKPHKNPGFVARMVAELRGEVSVRCVGLPAGFLGQRFGVDDRPPRVDYLGRLTDAELRDLYTGALAVVVPSTYEGFGLPALEALACGTHVVHCCEAVAEVVGGQGTALPADADGGDIAKAISAIAVTEEARAARRARAARYDWDDVAARVAAALLDRWPDLHPSS